VRCSLKGRKKTKKAGESGGTIFGEIGGGIEIGRGGRPGGGFIKKRRIARGKVPWYQRRWGVEIREDEYKGKKITGKKKRRDRAKKLKGRFKNLNDD